MTCRNSWAKDIISATTACAAGLVDPVGTGTPTMGGWSVMPVVEADGDLSIIQ